MRKTILTGLVCSSMTLIVLGAGAWAAGVIDPGDVVEAVRPAEVEGTFRVDGSVFVDGTDVEMPFTMRVEIVSGEPQLRSLTIGDRVSVTVPRVLQRQVSEATEWMVEYVGDAARFGLQGLTLGLHIDALRVEFVISADAPFPNPYWVARPWDERGAQEGTPPPTPAQPPVEVAP